MHCAGAPPRGDPYKDMSSLADDLPPEVWSVICMFMRYPEMLLGVMNRDVREGVHVFFRASGCRLWLQSDSDAEGRPATLAPVAALLRCCGRVPSLDLSIGVGFNAGWPPVRHGAGAAQGLFSAEDVGALSESIRDAGVGSLRLGYSMIESLGRHAAALGRQRGADGVTALELTRCSSVMCLGAILCGFGGLRRLTLDTIYRHQWTEGLVCSLEGIAPRLESLSLNGSEAPVEALLRILGAANSLGRLQIVLGDLDHSGEAEGILSLPAFRGTSHLSVRGQFTERHGFLCGCIGGWVGVQDLVLRGLTQDFLVHRGQAFSALSSLPRLVSLDLSRNDMVSGDVVALAEAFRGAPLSKLDLSGNDLRDPSISTAWGELRGLTNLAELSVRSCRLSPTVVGNICTLFNGTTGLKLVDARGNGIKWHHLEGYRPRDAGLGPLRI